MRVSSWTVKGQRGGSPVALASELRASSWAERGQWGGRPVMAPVQRDQAQGEAGSPVLGVLCWAVGLILREGTDVTL